MRNSLTTILCILASSSPIPADTFDNYFNDVLALVPTSKNAQKVEELTPSLMVQHSRVLPGISGTFLVVKSNEGRFAKLLIQPGRQKLSSSDSVPIVLIERYVTFREGEERAVQARGENLRLFHDFRLNLDIGQIVPKELTADLRLVADGDKVFLTPVGKAEMFLVTKHLSEADPKKDSKLVVGEKFENRFWNGSFRLHDDGRRSGLLKLNVNDTGDVSGDFYSDKDGRKYEVSGKVGTPNYRAQFRITYPRTVQFFDGLIFTGNAGAITGITRTQERETGFYAVRMDAAEK